MPENVWLGVSVEPPLYLSRVDLLRKACGTGPKFISAEPLLADLGSALDLSGISQVIAGGESGLHLRDPALRARRGMADPPPGKRNAVKGWIPRPDRIPWALHLRDACLKAGVAFFWKQWGGATIQSAGYILDGREWSEQPRTLGEDGSWRDSAGEAIYSRRAPSGEPNTSTIPAHSRLFSAESVSATHDEAPRTFEFANARPGIAQIFLEY
jgi:Protein of unknown function (DUF5131)